MKNKLLKNVAMLYLMNISKMVLPLITLPYLTRVLSVESYGVVSYVKATMQYMQIIVDFGFMLSGTKDIVLVAGDKKKLNYEIGNIFYARVILSCAAGIVLLIATQYIEILRENVLFVILSFVSVFMTIFLFDYIFKGLEKMEVITIRFVIMKGIAAILTFVFVKNDLDILWIPVLDILGSAVAIALVFIEMKKMDITLKTDGIRAIFSKIKSSAVYFFSNFSTTALTALNTLLIGIFINEVEVAYWSLCTQMTTAVTAMYTPLTNGIYPEMIKNKNINIIKKAILIYVPVIIVGCIFTVIIAKYALLILGGEEYTPAAPLLRALTPIMFLGFLSILFGWPMLGAIGKQKETAQTTIAAALLQVFGIIVLVLTQRFTIMNVALLRCISELFLCSSRMLFCYKYRKEFVK